MNFRPTSKFLLKTILVAALFPLAFALSAQAETLDEALALAYTNNPAIASERAKLRSVDETVAEAVSNWRPIVQAQADGGIEQEVYDTTPGNLTPADAGVTVTQPIYRGGRTVAQTDQAENNVKAERAQLVQTEQTVLVNAATAYLDMLQDQTILDLNKDNEAELKSRVGEMRERFHLGERTRTDISETEARLARAQADRRAAEVKLRVARSSYVRYIGQQPGELHKPELKLNLPDTQDAAADQAEKEAPSVVAADFTERAAQANVDLVRGNLLPEVSLQGGINSAWNENIPEENIPINHSSNKQVMLQVKIPLYTGGADYARLREAYQTQSEKRTDLDEAKREAAEQVAQAWEQVQAAAETMSVRADQVAAAQAALKGMKLEERVGDRSTIDTLNTEQELLDARIAAVQAEHDHAVAQIQLMAATGDFTAEALKLKVDLYDPEKHYDENRDRWFGTGDAADQ